MKRVPFAIIQAAKKFDAEAVEFVFRHFEGFIASQCLIPCREMRLTVRRISRLIRHHPYFMFDWRRISCPKYGSERKATKSRERAAKKAAP